MNAHLPPILAQALAPFAPPQSIVHRIVADARVSEAERRALFDLLDASRQPRFACVSCSQCGNTFGPGDAGFSDCREHRRQFASEMDAIRDHHDDEYKSGLDDVDGRYRMYDEDDGNEVTA